MEATAKNGGYDQYGYKKKAPGLGFIPMTTSSALEQPALGPSLAVSGWVDGRHRRN